MSTAAVVCLPVDGQSQGPSRNSTFLLLPFSLMFSFPQLVGVLYRKGVQNVHS